MIQSPSRFLALCFSCLLPMYALAEAPIVDDSENFAILDDNQTAVQSGTNAKYDDNDADDEIALAQDNGSPAENDSDPVGKIQNMQQEIRELRGQLEVQAHDLKMMKQQQLSFYKDLDARLSNHSVAQTAPATAPIELDMSSNSTNVPAPAAKTTISTPVVLAPNPNRKNPADEQMSYMTAYDLVKNKHFDDALTSMQVFVQQYPHGGYTANAQYWLGELFMVKKNYAQAIEHFETVLKQFPTSSKAAACTLKIGYALAASGKENEAKKSLQQVISNYPDTPTAQLAATKLRSINAS